MLSPSDEKRLADLCASINHHGPSELRKVLTWTTAGIRGRCLIIEEADSVLRKRTKGEDKSSKTLQEEASEQNSS